MALLNCYECGGKVSDKAHACPHCGAPVINKSSFIVSYDGEQMDATDVIAAMYNRDSNVKHKIWDMCDEAGIPEDDLTIGGFIDQIYALYEREYGQKPEPIQLIIQPSDASLRQAEFENRMYEERTHDKQKTNNVPKCPVCGSTRLAKQGVAGRAVSGFIFGGLSVEGRAQFICQKCGYKF